MNKKDPNFIALDKEYLIKIGENIVQKRGEKGMTQLDLAINSDMEDTALWRIEKGKTNPTIKTLLKVARGLGVEILDLLPPRKEE